MKHVVLICLLLAAAPAFAAPVGEAHLVAQDASAPLRDAAHRPDVRVTVWYPAAAGSAEQDLLIGPPAAPLFRIGAVAPGAPMAPGGNWPVILLSHGFGGSARIMAWFGIAMARAGAIVIAVDHPGNNAVDPMTIPGAGLWWDRAEDLKAALAAAQRDPRFGPRIDAARIGLAGFSAGGFTALVAAGARVDRAAFLRFCARHPHDGVCAPQKEFPIDLLRGEAVLNQPPYAAEIAHAGDDHGIAHVRAVFVMAPALVQALDPASLAALRMPVTVMLGDSDRVAPPASNGLVVARTVPGAALIELHGVGHYDFLATCTPAGRRVVPECDATVPQDVTHLRAIQAATKLFASALR
jgi:predicted dienelactone hydrolase